MNILFEEFLKIARHLNKELEIIPVLYGSLGLQQVSGIDFSPQDIDVLVPLKFINEEWTDLKQTIEYLGYEFVDLHEHQFRKNNIKLAFAPLESLAEFAGVNHSALNIVQVNAVKYKSLTLDDYLKVYSKSFSDGYRSTKNNNKDLIKIEAIKNILR